MSNFLSRAFAGLHAAANDASAASAAPVACFHCTLPIAGTVPFWAEYGGRLRPMCCSGCQAVFTVVVAHGLTAIYSERDAEAVA